VPAREDDSNKRRIEVTPNKFQAADTTKAMEKS
jgi:hypothetical protein